MPRNLGGRVYGTILVATLLAAEGPRRETYPKAIGAVVLALLVYWLAIAYAEYTGERASAEEHFTLAGYVRAIGHEVAVIYGALGPLLTMVICWALGAPLSQAFTAAVWTAAAIIAVTEVVIGLRSQLDGHDLIIQTGFGVLLGLLVVAVRVLLH